MDLFSALKGLLEITNKHIDIYHIGKEVVKDGSEHIVLYRRAHTYNCI